MYSSGHLGFSNLVLTLIGQLPWLAIAVVAAIVFFRGEKTIPVIVQAISACGVATMVILRELLWMLVRWLNGGWELMGYVSRGIGFLVFVLLCVFAGAYIVEKFKKKKKDAAGFPVAPG